MREFLRELKAMNSQLEAMLIKPWDYALYATSVPIDYEDDWTCIPVNIRDESGQVIREYENGVLAECQHEEYDEIEPKKYVVCEHCDATGYFVTEDYDGEIGLEIEWED